MKRVLVTRPLPDEVTRPLRALAEVDVRAETTPMTAPELEEALGAYDAILPTLGDALSAETLSRAGQVRTRLLANFGVGYNHIDVDAARARGIAVTNTPGVLTDATADLALTLLLATARRAGEGERLLRAGRWTGWHPTQ
ncbi:MAG: D-glycerate dehydrogenase, partial [Alphaproteobacteria bacterium]